jgi:hypothetical protein
MVMAKVFEAVGGEVLGLSLRERALSGLKV